MFFRFRISLQFLVLLVVGIILFLLTGHLWLGVVLPSLRAGWRSGQTAVWVLRTDVVRRRAVIGGLFCVAMACWKSAASAFVSLLAIVGTVVVLGQEPNVERFAAVMTVLAGAVVLTSLIGLAGAVAALLKGVRLWVHPELPAILEASRREEVSPVLSRKQNHAIHVLATSLSVPLLFAGAWVLVEPGSGVRALVVMGTSVALVAIGFVWLAPRIIAEDVATGWEVDPETFAG
ncbi:MAG: hypothetical protein VX304_01520 [Planctomycetota bacterium]|nr:hypothetical protein [Planctomycetota bacterium]